jgi:hypothetical protein
MKDIELAVLPHLADAKHLPGVAILRVNVYRALGSVELYP